MSDFAAINGSIMPRNNITNSTPTVNSMPSSPTSPTLIAAGDTVSKTDSKDSLLSAPFWNQTSGVDKNFPAAAHHLLFVANGNLQSSSKTSVPLNRVQNSLTSGPQCLSPARFSQVVDVDNTLSTIFSAQPMSSETFVIATMEVPYLMRFDVHPIRDIGSTLKIQAELHEVLKAPVGLLLFM